MPVQLPNPELDFVGQYNRLSASQVNTWKACPRLWYYEKVRRFVMPQIPILYVGRAVEEAICKTLKESPALIVSSAPADIYAPTPLDAEGRPDRNYDKKWPAEQLLLLPDSKWPTKATPCLNGQVSGFFRISVFAWKRCVSSGQSTTGRQVIGRLMLTWNDAREWQETVFECT